MSYVCDYVSNQVTCGDKFGKEYVYHRHRLDVHQVLPPVKYKTYACGEDQCDHVSMTDERRKDHKIKSHGLIISCTQGCGTTFKSSFGARMHAKKCEGQGLKRRVPEIKKYVFYFKLKSTSISIVIRILKYVIQMI